MKKVVNINLGGRVFSIEEDAFKELQEYLESIKKHFKHEDETGEICNDIEDSISLKLNSQKKNLQNAVTAGDISNILKEMGSIKELTEGEESVSTQENEEETTQEKKSRQLYRNGEERIIAGVASGIANYFGVDPIIPRIFFVILIFANGMGILIYIVLWFIVPVAKTASQKRSMRGEASNLESIEKYFEEKTKKKIDKNKIQAVLSFPIMIIDLCIKSISKILPILRVLFGASLALLSSVCIFTLITALIAIMNSGEHLIMDPNSRIVFEELLLIEDFSLIVSSLFLILFIPFFLLLLSGFYLILKKKLMGLGVFIFLFIIWMTSVSYFVVSVTANIHNIERIAETAEEHIENSDEYYIHIGSHGHEH